MKLKIRIQSQISISSKNGANDFLNSKLPEQGNYSETYLYAESIVLNCFIGNSLVLEPYKMFEFDL